MTKRDEYVEKLKVQLDQWNAEVAKWEARAKESQASVQSEYDKQLESFRRQRDQSQEHLRQIQAASGEAWADLMRGADDAWAKMREAFERARSHYNK